MKLIILLAVLLSPINLVLADTGQDLIKATDAFERAKAAMTGRVNTLPQNQRVAIWTQYYLALEHLQRMDVHNKMMMQHNADRSEEFRKVHAEFVTAMDKLLGLLADIDSN